MRAHSVVVMCLWLPVGFAPLALAKGLDQLSEQNPENVENAAQNGNAASETVKAETAPTPSEASRAIADKLTIGTSFGWVNASRSQGSWKAGGMSDITLAYKLANLATMPLAVSYRYAPVAVTGKVDGHYYRGVWEGHYLGARLGFPLSGSMTAYGSGELGYMKVSLSPVDGLEPKAKHGKSAASLAIGGGLDFNFFEKSAVAFGPRTSVALGSHTVIQIGGAASYAF